VPLSDAVWLGLFQGLYERQEALEMAVGDGERRLQESIARVSTQVDAASAEIRRLADALAARPEVDLTQEVEQLNALADRLDAAVPDPVAPPAPPAP
jgi:hypothetical protein